MDMDILILAKGTSTRVPLKNWRMFAGLPLVGWPIHHARSWFPSARVFVASEYGPIQKYAISAGCHIYPLREKYLRDGRTASDLIGDFCAASRADLCVALQPTSPFVFENDLRGAIADPRPYVRSGWRRAEHTPKTGATLSQEIPPSTFLTGCFWAAKRTGVRPPPGVWTREGSVYACESPLCRVDINSPSDFARAEWVARYIPVDAFSRKAD